MENPRLVSASLQQIKSIKNPIKHFLFFHFIKFETSDSFVSHFDGHFAYLKTLDFYLKQCSFSFLFFSFFLVRRASVPFYPVSFRTRKAWLGKLNSKSYQIRHKSDSVVLRCRGKAADLVGCIKNENAGSATTKDGANPWYVNLPESNRDGIKGLVRRYFTN